MTKKEYNKIIAENISARKCDRYSWLGAFGWWKEEIPTAKQLRAAMNRRRKRYWQNLQPTNARCIYTQIIGRSRRLKASDL